MVKTLKNLLVRNRSSDFQKISQGWPLKAPLKKLFKEIWFVKKHGHRSSLNFACLFVFAYFVKTFKNLPHFLSDPFQICTVSLYQWGHEPYKKWALLVHEVQNYLPLNWENGVYAIKSKFFIQFFPNLHSVFISMKTRALSKMSNIGPLSPELSPWDGRFRNIYSVLFFQLIVLLQ